MHEDEPVGLKMVGKEQVWRDYAASAMGRIQAAYSSKCLMW